MEQKMKESSQQLYNYIVTLANSVEEIKASLCVLATKNHEMATAVKVNRSQIIASDATMHHTRKHITQIDTILQEITGCLDKTTKGLELKLRALEEVVTNSTADLTKAVNTSLREMHTLMDTTHKTNSH
jgi:methyl-accepting chemotaxis protein